VDIQTITIRQMTPRDADLFVEFYAALSEESLFFFTAHDPNPPMLRELIAGIANEPNVRRFAAVRGVDGKEEMAGYVFLWTLDTAIPWLGICVRDSYKGIGVGKMLMRHAEAFCQAHGKGGILLTTHQKNYKAQSLYQKVGYEQIGFDDRGEILMILRLKDQNWRAE
jgi:ribosomal protein S18 acetylase RimI-like enzyme